MSRAREQLVESPPIFLELLYAIITVQTLADKPGFGLVEAHAEGFFFSDLAFSPDGNTLVATSLSGIAHLWRAPSWEEIAAAEKRRGAR